MKKSNKYLLTAAIAAMLAFTACTDHDTTPGSSGDSTEDANVLPTSEPELDADTRTVTGVAVDGSRRSLYLQVQTDTIILELPPSDDDNFTWKEGDTISVTFVKDTQGNDSIGQIRNHDGLE